MKNSVIVESVKSVKRTETHIVAASLFPVGICILTLVWVDEQQYFTLREPNKSESDCLHVGRHLIEPLSAAHLQVSRQFQGGQVSYWVLTDYGKSVTGFENCKLQSVICNLQKQKRIKF